MGNVAFSSEFISEMKMELKSQKEHILNSINYAEEDKKKILSNEFTSKDSVDVAFDNMDGNTLEILGAVEKNTLELINKALYRISNNVYGLCLSCGSKIDEKRLRALPYAFLCISCQTKKERLRK